MPLIAKYRAMPPLLPVPKAAFRLQRDDQFLAWFERLRDRLNDPHLTPLAICDAQRDDDDDDDDDDAVSRWFIVDELLRLGDDAGS